MLSMNWLTKLWTHLERQDGMLHRIGWLYASGLYLLHDHMITGVSEFFMSLFMAGFWAGFLMLLIVIIPPLMFPLVILCVASMTLQLLIQTIWRWITPEKQ